MKKKSKEEIIAEYLSGDYTFRELGIKHNIPYRTIAGWVWADQGRKISWREKIKSRKEKQTGIKEPELPNELKLLQKELRKQQLHNKLLEEIIRIGEKHTGIDWKKNLAPSRHECRAI